MYMLSTALLAEVSDAQFTLILSFASQVGKQNRVRIKPCLCHGLACPSVRERLFLTFDPG